MSKYINKSTKNIWKINSPRTCPEWQINLQRKEIVYIPGLPLSIYLLAVIAIPYPFESIWPPTCIRSQLRSDSYSIFVLSIRNAYLRLLLKTRLTPSRLLDSKTVGSADSIWTHIWWYVEKFVSLKKEQVDPPRKRNYNKILQIKMWELRTIILKLSETRLYFKFISTGAKIIYYFCNYSVFLNFFLFLKVFTRHAVLMPCRTSVYWTFVPLQPSLFHYSSIDTLY